MIYKVNGNVHCIMLINVTGLYIVSIVYKLIYNSLKCYPHKYYCDHIRTFVYYSPYIDI